MNIPEIIQCANKLKAIADNPKSLAALRRFADLQQQDLADFAHVKLSKIADIENCRQGIEPELGMRLLIIILHQIEIMPQIESLYRAQ